MKHEVINTIVQVQLRMSDIRWSLERYFSAEFPHVAELAKTETFVSVAKIGTKKAFSVRFLLEESKNLPTGIFSSTTYKFQIPRATFLDIIKKYSLTDAELGFEAGSSSIENIVWSWKGESTEDQQIVAFEIHCKPVHKGSFA